VGLEQVGGGGDSSLLVLVQSNKHVVVTASFLHLLCDFLRTISLECKGIIPSNAHISTPFFQKIVFFFKICFGSPPQNFWRYV
jgi:hypothetical protein